ncbi:hypothetical protein AMECASPLE_020536 [Ameca splendens]|uniref:Uncharacterized protein n=1 Tax=Ameca splendens TaxID=208324 RepID=A0ABV0Y3G7_9TELE
MSFNCLAASCLDQPRTTSSEPCPPSITTRLTPVPQSPTTCFNYLTAPVSSVRSFIVVFPPPGRSPIIPICFLVPAHSVSPRFL